jgi:hypothetical protein
LRVLCASYNNWLEGHIDNASNMKAPASDRILPARLAGIQRGW